MRMRTCLILIAMLTGTAAAAQEYPSRPVRMVVPFTAGSGSDILARLIAPRLLEGSGQRVIVDNRAGAGGTIGAAIVATATPDGHTLLLTSSGFASSASLYPNLPYDSIRDFAGITQVISSPLVLVVAPSLGIKSLKDLIAQMRQKPGQMTYASTGVGSATHYATELLRAAAKFEATHVPYKGVPEALTDTMTGRVNFYMTTVLAAAPLIRDGRVIALAITTPQRFPQLPEVPTVAESAVPGFSYEGWYGMLVPGKTPRAIVNRLSTEMARILALPEVREKIVGVGGEAKWIPPEAFDRMIRSEIETRGKLFKATAAKPE